MKKMKEMPWRGGGQACISSPQEAPHPSNQTDLNVHSRVLLKGGGGRIHEVTLIGPAGRAAAPNRWAPAPWSFPSGSHFTGW